MTRIESATAVGPSCFRSSAVDQPLSVTLPLRRRLERLDTGALSADRWRVDAVDWARHADERFRATVDLREPPVEEHPWIRVGVKDTIDVASWPTRLGLHSFRHHAQQDAEPVAAIASGVIAKLVTTTLNIGVGSGCRNPWFPDVDPAGSSTGSAVAVAAGICDLSLGTDVLGSIRWPAGRCGVVGLRTTCGRYGMRGVLPLAPSMDAVGWVTRTAADLGTAWQYFGLRNPIETAEQLSIGIPLELEGDELLDEEVAMVLRETASLLTALGHHTHRTALAEWWEIRGAAWELCAREAWDGYRGWRTSIDEDLDASTTAALQSGRRVTAQRSSAIREQMRSLRTSVSAHFHDAHVDMWLLPLDPGTPRRISDATPASTFPHPEDPSYEREVGFTPIASFLGLPAITLPISTTRDGRAPLAVQIIGRPGADEQLIDLACAIERQRGDSIPTLDVEERAP